MTSRLVERVVYAAAVALWAAWSILDAVAATCGALFKIDAEKNRVAARSASRGRGGQSATRPPAIPPRPCPPPADETAAACDRLFDLHLEGGR